MTDEAVANFIETTPANRPPSLHGIETAVQRRRRRRQARRGAVIGLVVVVGALIISWQSSRDETVETAGPDPFLPDATQPDDMQTKLQDSHWRVIGLHNFPDGSDFQSDGQDVYLVISGSAGGGHLAMTGGCVNNALYISWDGNEVHPRDPNFELGELPIGIPLGQRLCTKVSAAPEVLHPPAELFLANGNLLVRYLGDPSFLQANRPAETPTTTSLPPEETRRVVLLEPVTAREVQPLPRGG